MQEFKRAARGSGYKGQPLVEKFKRGINGVIRRRLMESENQLGSIEQWYKRATALDRNWRESRREEERLRKKEGGGGGVPKQERTKNNPKDKTVSLSLPYMSLITISIDQRLLPKLP